jgi:competence protein ComEC
MNRKINYAIVKKMIGVSALLFGFLVASAQTQLEIHQINVGNGDGALIKFYDKDVLKYTMVVDGGLKSTDNTFIPYLKKFIPENADKKFVVDWVILSHNHQDHFNGLVEMFNDASFVVKEITDQGGYTIGAAGYTLPLPVPTNTNTLPYITRDTKKGKKNDPQPALTTYVKAVQTVNTRSNAYFKTPIVYGTFYDATTMTFDAYDLPAIGGIRPSIYFITGNAFTKGKAARDIGGSSPPNPNNFSIGWILEYGQFRFYSAGDLGGYSSGYTDQETPVSTYLKTKFPTNYPLTGASTAKNYPGHVCAMKTDHHGSTQSSNPTFLSTLAYSAIITSAGMHQRWKIPTVEFVNRVAANEVFGEKQGIYFTQLYNYKKNQSLARANLKFKGQANYDYIEPGSTPDKQFSYIIVVEPKAAYPGPPPKTIDITKQCYFEVEKVQTDNFKVTAQYGFLCHKPS